MLTTCLIVGLGFVGNALKKELESLFKVYYVTKDVNGDMQRNITSEEELKPTVVFYCLPTNTNPLTKILDTSLLESSVEARLKAHPDSIHIITSTLPLLPSKKLKSLLEHRNVLFVPEFRTESSLVEGSLSNRLIIGMNSIEVADRFISLFPKAYFNTIFKISIPEAISVKLYANAYLATRVAFFNDMTRSLGSHGIDPMIVIDVMSSDDRIGNHYNKPSTGFGGPCLPKDTLSLATSTSSQLLNSVLVSNASHTGSVVDALYRSTYKRIGLLGIGMKPGSTSVKESTILSIGVMLQNLGKEVRYYDDVIHETELTRVSSLTELLATSDIILTNDYSLKNVDNTPPIITVDILFNEREARC